MTNNKSERSISRENLEKHGIYYNDKGSSILPAHVRVVRDMLLSFEHIIPDGGWKETLRKEESEYDLKDVWDEARHPPDTAWVHMEAYEVNLPTKSPQWNKANEDTISCQMVAKKAQGLREDAEDGWMHFWRTSTFHRVSEKVRDQPGFQ